jgi:hypothetical protein
MSDALNISDGDITVDFADANSGYVLVAEGYRPAVAQEDPNRPELTLPVDEEFRLFIEGSSPADAASKLEDLTEIVHRAARLWRGEMIDPVIYQYQIANSTLGAPLEDMVIGAPESNAILELPAGYDSATMTSVIGSAQDPIIWRLRRRGGWLDEEESQSSSAVADPGKMTTASLTAINLFSPTDIEIAIDGAPSVAAASHSGFLVFVDDASDLAFLEAEAATKSNFTTHVDAGASGGNVAQMDVGATIATLTWSSPTISTDARLFYIFVHAKRNGTGSFPDCRGRITPANPPTGNPKLIDSGPQPFFLGIWATNAPLEDVQFRVVVDSPVTSGNELEVDYLVVVAVKDTTRVIAIPEFSQASVNHREETYIQHRLLSHRAPLYYQYDGSSNKYNAYEGNLYCHMRNASLTGFIMVGGDDGSTWNTGEDYILTATRRARYRVPR